MGNVTSNIAAKFAFFPPEPPSYDVFKDEEDTPNGDKRYCFTGITADKNVDVHLPHRKVGKKIVGTFLETPFRFLIVLLLACFSFILIGGTLFYKYRYSEKLQF
ncbi:hypothetical protein L2E82_41058 [Cichorium intybus]|uniref:Uncharacterized protein n=1 Tax=Cichorium intybus TaxID=13427 RepID=A0ACB9ALT4_CICIN|nr:hypothetical protein L2E82_41058 [Cichorium intybus]